MNRAIHNNVVTVAVCAKCGKQAVWKGNMKIIDITHSLRNAGWSVGSEHIYCDKCRKTRKLKCGGAER